MELHQISERQSVLSGSASQSEKDKSLGDMFSDLLQKITGSEAAVAAASHSINLENLPELHVAPLKEREAEVLDEPAEEVEDTDEAAAEQSKDSAEDTAEESVVVVSAVAKELTAKKEVVESAPELAKTAQTVAVQEEHAAPDVASEKFQMNQAPQQVAADQARSQLQMNADPAAAMQQVPVAGVSAEKAELETSVSVRPKAEQASIPNANTVVTAANTEEFVMAPAQSAAAPKAESSASPAAEYTRLQMILSGGAAGAHADGSASRGGLGADAASKVTTALSGTGESVLQGVDKSKAVTRIAPAQQARTIERIQQILDQAIRGRELNTIVVKLDPQDLGQLTVKLTQRGDEMFASIRPENPDVENLLKQKLPEITAVLAQSGLKLDNVHVSIGSERTDAETAGFQNFLGRNSAQGESNNSGHDSGRGRDVVPHAVVDVPQSQQGYAEMDAAWIA